MEKSMCSLNVPMAAHAQYMRIFSVIIGIYAIR